MNQVMNMTLTSSGKFEKLSGTGKLHSSKAIFDVNPPVKPKIKSKNGDSVDFQENYNIKISNENLEKMKKKNQLIKKLPMTPLLETPAKRCLNKSQTTHKLDLFNQ